MHTKLGPENPYGHNRYGFAWECTASGGAAHLDCGCGDGRFLAQLTGKNIGSLVGVDADRNAAERARAESAGRYEVLHIDRVRPLPFPDKAFSRVTLLDVLEHVDDQQGLLSELHRVLKDDGLLVVTVPGRHLFSFLDMGNFKFRFPRLHRWWYCRHHSRQEYQRRYAANPDGLIGDVSAVKRWHEHFSRPQLDRLLSESGFIVSDFDGTGYFQRPLKIMAWACNAISCLRTGIEKLIAADARHFESANVFCVAQKAGPHKTFSR